MAELIRSPQAQADIYEIGDYIAADSVQNAVRWLMRLDRFLSRIADTPGIGTAREEFGKGLRSVPFGRYVVYFRGVSGRVEIVRVIHGGRDADQVFGP